MVPLDPPVLEPDPVVPLELPELEPEPMPLELPEPVLPDGDVDVPPLAPEPDLLKCASHSEREIWPSLFVSTEEKLGAEVLPLALPDRPPLEVPALPPEVALPPEAALPPEDDAPDEPLDMPDEPLELEPDAAGEDEDLSLLVLLEELCANATLDSANSAAAVAALSTLSFNIFRFLLGE